MTASSERILTGITVSAGAAIGHAVRAFDPLFISLHLRINADEVAGEVARFRESVEKSSGQLRRMQAQLKRRSAEESSFLIDAHLLILQDRLFVDRIVAKIESDRINAEWAIQQVTEDLCEAYDRLDDDYLRERRGDLDDIVRRLLHNLQSKHMPPIRKLPYDAIIVGRSIPASALFELRSRHIAGLVTETGSSLSHTAIMARSMEIPTVMGVADLPEISSGSLLVVDGGEGIVIISPSAETLARYSDIATQSKISRRLAAVSASRPCATEDGVRISLGANINFSEEVHAAAESHCEYIGLYRTEFDFFREGSGQNEKSLAADYSAVLKAAQSMPVTFRTIDVGTDRNTWDSVNPSLSTRGLRFCLENQSLFRAQLGALLRTSVKGNLRILLPFVSSVDELDAALSIIADVKKDLSRRKESYAPHIPIGVMIETPAAAQTCDLMASRVDFLCLGTNDLIQYYLVIDRSDQSTAHLYNPFHPAILRCLNQVHTLLEPSLKPITVCGEMAADPASAAVLLGLGFTSLSVSLGAYPRMRQFISSMNHGQLRELASEILKMQKPAEIESRVRASIGLQASHHS
jgi:phosphoenolpyruvate-protein phosphotransferase (PTS system enzyme I)